MPSSRQILGVVLVAVLAAGVVVAAGLLPVPLADDGAAEVETGERSDEADVAVFGPDGEERAVVDAEVALTSDERYTGLSDHESLATGDGMLFPYDREKDRTFVMREMDFDIDIIYVGAGGDITSIHHARAPEADEDGNDLRYPGRGQWVLEVPRGYANETEMAVGDSVEIEYREE